MGHPDEEFPMFSPSWRVHTQRHTSGSYSKLPLERKALNDRELVRSDMMCEITDVF